MTRTRCRRHPELVIDTRDVPVEAAGGRILELMGRRGLGST